MRYVHHRSALQAPSSHQAEGERLGRVAAAVSRLSSTVLCYVRSCLLETDPSTEDPLRPIKRGDPRVWSANGDRGPGINT